MYCTIDFGVLARDIFFENNIAYAEFYSMLENNALKTAQYYSLQNVEVMPKKNTRLLIIGTAIDNLIAISLNDVSEIMAGFLKIGNTYTDNIMLFKDDTIEFLSDGFKKIILSPNGLNVLDNISGRDLDIKTALTNIVSIYNEIATALSSIATRFSGAPLSYSGAYFVAGAAPINSAVAQINSLLPAITTVANALQTKYDQTNPLIT